MESLRHWRWTVLRCCLLADMLRPMTIPIRNEWKRRLAVAGFTLLAHFSALASEDGLLLTLNLTPQKGERFQEAEFVCWLPDPSRPVRAVVVHQHGCGQVTAAHAPVTDDFHWRALARRRDCALLVPRYRVAGECAEWNDPESGSERALLAALEDFAERSGRPELSGAPWILWGHSGGSSWSVQMILRHPGRVLAASFRGGCHRQFGAPEFRARFAPAARELPMLFVWGRRETVAESRHHVSWAPMNEMYRELRAGGGRVARMIDPRSEHGCGDARLVVLPFFDAVLEARFAGEPLPGALVDLASFEFRDLNETSLRDPALAWLPTPELAGLWREFSESGTVRPDGSDLARPTLDAVPTPEGVRLEWSATPALDGGLRALRLYRDGELWKELGVGADDFLATSRDSPPEALRVSSRVVDAVRPGASHVYTIRYLDGGGAASPPSAPVRVGGE